MKRLLVVGALVATLCLVGYGVTPYWSMRSFEQSMRNADAEAAGAYVDWATLRSRMTQSAAVLIADKARSTSPHIPHPVAEQLALIPVRDIVERTVNQDTLENFFDRIARGNIAERSRTFSFLRLNRAFFDSPGRFSAQVSVIGQPSASAKLIFELQGLTWKVVDVQLPLEYMVRRGLIEVPHILGLNPLRT